MTNIEYTDKSITCSRSFDNEYQMRNWVKRFNRTAKRLNKIGYVINNFHKNKSIDYKIVGVKLSYPKGTIASL